MVGSGPPRQVPVMIEKGVPVAVVIIVYFLLDFTLCLSRGGYWDMMLAKCTPQG